MHGALATPTGGRGIAPEVWAGSWNLALCSAGRGGKEAAGRRALWTLSIYAKHLMDMAFGHFDTTLAATCGRLGGFVIR